MSVAVDASVTLAWLFDVVSRTLIPGRDWGRNLDAFNDILRGGFGTPDEGFVIRWRNAGESRDRLRSSLFDLLSEIIQAHSERGEEAGDGVELRLE